MSNELLDWVQDHLDLIKWLNHADENMKYGDIIIHYSGGKITSYDICPRLRQEVKKK